VTGADDWPQEPAERVRELVEEVLDELDLEGEVEIVEDDDRITASVVGDEDYGLLIGKRGAKVDELKATLEKRTGKKVKLNIQELSSKVDGLTFESLLGDPRFVDAIVTAQGAYDDGLIIVISTQAVVHPPAQRANSVDELAVSPTAPTIRPGAAGKNIGQGFYFIGDETLRGFGTDTARLAELLLNAG
jgi:predicted RNA-binding protein YlqC (UPF0109 family)